MSLVSSIVLPRVEEGVQLLNKSTKGHSRSNLSGVEFLRAIECNTWNLKLKFGGKIFKTILSNFVDGSFLI